MRIFANLDDADDLIKASAYLQAPNSGYTITGYGETSRITKNFKNYAEINAYLYPNCVNKINLSVNKQFDGSKDDPARALFFDGQIVFDPANTDVNVNTNFGVATIKIPALSRGRVNVDVNLQGMSVTGLLGLRGSRFGFDGDVSIVNGTLAFSFTICKKKININAEGIIGASASCLFIKNGFKLGAALGTGGSLFITFEDER